ncbi:MAG: TauD/TfdA family dioxygenase [Gammaproteobacteria bacterium]|nr:TauD/TfdA family dioxygenase [Gammaproteobacteria bacterium]
MPQLTESMRLAPIDSHAAWTADELAADTSWTYRFSPADIAELEAAVRGVQSRDLGPSGFAQRDFPLPNLASQIDRIMQQVETGRGVGLFRGIPTERYDEATLTALYWGLGTYFGDAISQNSRGETVAEVIDKGNDHGDMNVRGYKTRAELSPHVDSCALTTLLCVHPAKSGGDSLVTSSMSLYNRILTDFPEYLDVYYRGFYHDLRGEGPTGKIDEVTHYEIPVFSYFEDTLSCAFNSRIMRSAREKVGPPLTAHENDAIDLIISLAQDPTLQYRMRLESGDVQLVNNYCVMHARDIYTDFDDAPRKRRLLRLWLNLRQPRPLAPNFADRYNTGPGGGVAVGDGARYAF